MIFCTVEVIKYIALQIKKLLSKKTTLDKQISYYTTNYIYDFDIKIIIIAIMNQTQYFSKLVENESFN